MVRDMLGHFKRDINCDAQNNTYMVITTSVAPIVNTHNLYSSPLTVWVMLQHSESACAQRWLAEARKLTASREILLWMTPSEAPKALQASECSELLDPMRASCWISAQH